MNKNTPVSAAKLWTVFAKCYRALYLYVDHSVTESGLCLSDFMVLEALLHKGPLSISQIGEKVLLASGSMTAAMDRLEKKGLITRELSREDRRARVIHLTPQGRRLIQAMFDEHEADLEAVVSVLQPAERNQLYRGLKALGLATADRLREGRIRDHPSKNVSKGRKSDHDEDSTQ